MGIEKSGKTHWLFFFASQRRCRTAFVLFKHSEIELERSTADV